VNWEYVINGMLGIAVFCYLLFALIKPEKL
jgi:K+-transporting ATPase KdpF subunit